MKKFLTAWAFLECLVLCAGNVDYRDYQLANTSRCREETEWTTFYAARINEADKPRVTLVGDSICRDYQSSVSSGFGKTANCTYWTSSRCVTDPLFLAELNIILSFADSNVICFNNGLHSLTTNPSEYEDAYRKTIRFVRAKCPKATLFILTCTPVKDNYFNSVVIRLNNIATKIAKDENIAVIDMYSFMDRGSCQDKWRDGIHFHSNASSAQGQKIVDSVKSSLAK